MKLTILVGLLLNVFPGLVNQLQAQTAIEGFWQMPGGSLIVSIGTKALSFYEVTNRDKQVGSAASCYQLGEKQLRDPLDFYLPLQRSSYYLIAKEQLSFVDEGAVSNPLLKRIKQLPKQCLNKKQFNSQYQPQPLVDLDIIWNAFSQHYGFLALRGISQQQWRDKYPGFKSKAINTKNARQLFSLLSEVLEYAAGEKNLSGLIIQADDHVEMQSEQFNWRYQVHQSPNYSRRRVVFKNPEKTYLSAYLETDKHVLAQSQRLLTKGDIWGVTSYFGKIKQQNIGYLQLNSMLDFASVGTKASLGEYQKLSRAGEHFMQQVMGIANMKKYSKMIIDIRNNFGGTDQIGLMIASYFNDRKREVFSKAQRIHSSADEVLWSAAIPWQLDSREDYFKGDIILLTSRYSVSAAEIFALAMSQIPRVTIIGEPTTGSLSDVSNVHTSNGWALSLSAEVYRKIMNTPKERMDKLLSNSVTNYTNSPEGVGVIPDVEVEYLGNKHYPLLSFMAVRQDRALERAIKH
ncbi:MAG: hypothetical protein OFPI_24800 [Osedax symbiont Rs2]|nr:MAG: hypothetical protein OFPI_24800 [Osedax symbiont Rs2]